MEALTVLEQKIAALIESKKLDLAVIQKTQIEVEQLRVENTQLKNQIETLQDNLLNKHKNTEKLNLVVDDLIKSIDLLVEQEPQQ